MPTLGPGITIGPGITTSFGVSQNSLVLDLNTNATLSYPGSGASWFDTSPSKLVMSGNGSFISSGANGLVSGATWSTATTDILNNDLHSIFFMIRFNSTGTYPSGTTGGWEQIFSYNSSGSDRSPGVWRYPSQRYIHWRYDPGNSGTDFGPDSIGGPGTEFALNTWYYVGVTKNGATATAYVNGTNLGTQTVSNPKTAGTSPVYLYPYYTNPLANLNNLLIYNRVLSNAEVSQNFTAIRGIYGI
jgi:hypothetical protein